MTIACNLCKLTLFWTKNVGSSMEKIELRNIIAHPIFAPIREIGHRLMALESLLTKSPKHSGKIPRHLITALRAHYLVQPHQILRWQ